MTNELVIYIDLLLSFYAIVWVDQFIFGCVHFNTVKLWRIFGILCSRGISYDTFLTNCLTMPFVKMILLKTAAFHFQNESVGCLNELSTNND